MLIQKAKKTLLLILLFLTATTHAAQTVTYFHNDIAGTPLIATDASGNVVWKENYYPYGERLNPETKRDNKLWFTGKPYDQDTGLTYLGARYYNPLLGRFMGVDPKGFDPENIHSFNRYAYANNNPYRYVDPDGHTPFDLVFLAYDIGKLGVALYSGQGVRDALVDVGFSALGVISPIPGLSFTRNATKIAKSGAEIASVAHKAGDVAKRSGIVAKDGTEITGFTKHGVDRVIGDGAKRAGTKPDAIIDAFKNPSKIKEGIDSKGRPFKIYTGENARVVINPETGQIVSTNPLSRVGAHLP